MKTPSWRRCVAVFACFVLSVPLLYLQLVAQGSTDEEVQQIAAALDTNGNRVLNDAEIRQAIQFWIGESVVPGVNRTISDAVVLKLIQMWILGQTITAGPTGSFQIEGVFQVDVNAEGLLVTKGPSLQAVVAGSLVMVTGKRFPQNPTVEVSGFETDVVAHDDTALVTFVPFAGPEPHPVELVISGRDDRSVKASTRFTITPFDAASIADPARTISDFVQATRTALAGGPRSAQDDDVLRALTQLENAIPIMSDGEHRSIAASIVASNIMTLLGKSAATPQTMGPSATPIRLALYGPGVFHLVPEFIGGILRLAQEFIRIQYPFGELPPPPSSGNLSKRAPNAPLTVSFTDLSSQEPVEGVPQSFACLAKDDDTISEIKVSVGDYSGAYLVDANGNAVTELTLTRDPGKRATSEKFSVHWNSKVTGKARPVLFACIAHDGPAIQGPEALIETYPFVIQATSNSAPVIVDIDAPGRFPGDGQPHDVTVNFADQDGNVARLRIEVLEGPSAGQPPQTLTLNVAGLVTGEITFSISCQNAGSTFFNVTQRLVLIDAAGLESAPKSHAYTCEKVGAPG